MFKNVFSTSGRISRKEYCITFLITFVSCWLIYPTLVMVPAASTGDTTFYIALTFYFILIIFSMYVCTTQAVKRCHDIGVSGWFLLLGYYYIILLVEKGMVGDNEYGADPKAEA